MPSTYFSSVLAQGLTPQSLLLCTGLSLLFGLGIAVLHRYKNSGSKGFLVTLALLPAIVQVVIMMVNGNVGTGVAVAGAFSLVRFRSLPGSARDIMSIFFAMAVGLATGMGYLMYAALFLLVVGGASLVLTASPFGRRRETGRILRITIPENLDYETLFDGLLKEHTHTYRLDRVRTVNMGSMFELTYSVELKGPDTAKAFIDALRCLNGNLTVSLSRPLEEAATL